MSQFILLLIWLSFFERVSGHKFKRFDKCGRNSRPKNPYSTGHAFSNIECIDQCLDDKGCMVVTSCIQDGTCWRTCEKSNNMTSLQDCNNHEMNEKCSTWEMIDPCLNGGTLINNICVCPLPYKGVRCQFYQPVSCLEICQMSLNKNQTVVSQMYFLYTSTQKRIEVFCDFKNETFGTMFIPRSSLFQLTQSEFKEFVPDSKEFIFRERLDNQEENEAIISTLPSFQGQPWTITLRADTTKFDLLPQEPKSPYIYIGGIPRDKIAEAKKYGFVINGKEYMSVCNDASNSNYFIFYTEKISVNQKNFDQCKEWQKELKTKVQKPLPSEDFFYFIEIHIKCMAWCLHKDFISIIGIAPGFIFR